MGGCANGTGIVFSECFGEGGKTGSSRLIGDDTIGDVSGEMLRESPRTEAANACSSCMAWVAASKAPSALETSSALDARGEVAIVDDPFRPVGMSPVNRVV